jgi:putative peptidoglycan lipid II flippase
MTEKSLQSQMNLSEKVGQAESEKKAITRAAGVVGLWTSVSRILGFVRDMVIASFMGAGIGADAFFVAFRIPNLLRRLFAEGALSAAFVPTFVETLQEEGRQGAAKLARQCFTFSAVVLLLVTLLGIVFSPWVVRLVAPGFHEDPSKFGLTVELNRIMFPYIFFISLVALASGVLNSLGKFAAPAAAPVLLNISMIAAVVVFSVFLNVDPVFALAWGVVAAGLLQLLLQIPFVRHEGIKLSPDFEFNHPRLKKIGVLFVPAAFSGAVYQINVMIGTILASLLPAGAVSWLYYADRLVELPLGVFAVALGTAVLPSMSRQAGMGDLKALGNSVCYSLRLIAFFTLPALVGLIVLGEPIVSVLFQRGRFTFIDTQQTAYALTWYSVGLWAFSGLKVVTQAFYSLKDTKTPLWISLAAVAANLIFGVLLMGPMAHGGLALATSLAAALNVGLLLGILIKRLEGFPWQELMWSTLRICLASLIMGAVAYQFSRAGNWSSGIAGSNLIILTAGITSGLISFALSAYLLRCREMHSLISYAMSFKNRKSPN